MHCYCSLLIKEEGTVDAANELFKKKSSKSEDASTDGEMLLR